MHNDSPMFKQVGGPCFKSMRVSEKSRYETEKKRVAKLPVSLPKQTIYRIVPTNRTNHLKSNLR